jgi:hypothetical protein
MLIKPIVGLMYHDQRIPVSFGTTNVDRGGFVVKQVRYTDQYNQAHQILFFEGRVVAIL